MTTVRSNPILVFFFFITLLLITPSQSQSISFSSYYRFRNLFSYAHSIFTGVADLRAARGDVAGADRAKAIADSLDKFTGFGFLRLVWSAWNWTWWHWKDLSLTELYGSVSDINELLSGLSEFTRLDSATEKTAWISRNYQNLLTVTSSISRKLVKTFGESEVVKGVVETLQAEVVEGGLIKDCLSLGSSDLKNLIQVVKDLMLQFFPATDKDPEL